MPELDYNDFSSHLKSLPQKELSPVYLFWGEEFLYQTALEELLDLVFTSAEKRLNYDVVDNAADNIHEVVEKINTYSLLSGPKVVVLKDSKIFYSNLPVSDFFEKAKSAYDTNDIKKASGYILNLISRLKLTYGDLADKAERNERLKYDAGMFGNDLWLEKIIDFCMGNRLAIPAGMDHADILQRAIEKGFPGGNHLIITTDMVDKRRTLYKCVLKAGTVVNCFVPKGERRADKTAQREVLDNQLRAFLARAGKTIQKEASDCLFEMTGFDLRTFTSNLEKLVSYVGDRTEISKEDIETVLHRTKKDPLFELTNSVAERNMPRAIFFLNSLLSDNFHPLQMLAAITNQVRKLLIIRDFMESSHGAKWQGPQMKYPRFRDAVMPDLLAYDRDILNRLGDWEKEKMVAGSEEIGKPSKGKGKISSDLGIVKNPQNPYPVFQLAQNAQGFSLDGLQAVMKTLCDADVQMKTTPKDPRLILEKVIFTICGDARN